MGRSYEAVIRVNSQSGKGGVAYIMKAEHGLDLPRRLQIEFSAAIQRLAEATGTEVTADRIWSAFEAAYLRPGRRAAPTGAPAVEVLDSHQHALDEGARTVVYVEVRVDGTVRWGVGLDPDPRTAGLHAVASAANRDRTAPGPGQGSRS